MESSNIGVLESDDPDSCACECIFPLFRLSCPIFLLSGQYAIAIPKCFCLFAGPVATSILFCLFS